MDLMNTLSFAELNIYVVLIHCCLSPTDSDDIMRLHGWENPPVSVDDLMDHNWDRESAIQGLRKLESKGLLHFKETQNEWGTKEEILLTSLWKLIIPVWDEIKHTRKKMYVPTNRIISKPEYIL